MSNIINNLFSAEKAPPFLFLLMVYLIGVTTGNLGDALQDWFKPWQIAIFGAGLMVIIMLVLDPIPRFVNYLIRKRVELAPGIGAQPERYKGLIVLGSITKDVRKEPISAEVAIRYHYKNERSEQVLRHCWLLASGSASLKVVEQTIEKLKSEGFSEDLFETVYMSGDDADKPIEVYNAVEKIYKNLPAGFNESDIIADYTGGTKSMTAGLVLACASPGRKLQMLKPKAYKDDGTADREKGSDPKLINISFKLKQV